MKIQHSVIALFFFIVSVSSSSFAGEFHETCESFSVGQKWEYCVSQELGSSNPDVVFFFHGAGDDEHSWTQRGEFARDYWNSIGASAPKVVTISFGPVWLLAEKNGARASGLLTFFIDTVLPTLEKKFGGIRGRKILLGASMGGFNVTQLLLKHGALFSKAALICPAITSISPYASQLEVEKFILRTGADPQKVYYTRMMQKTFYPNQEAWLKADPLVIGPTHLSPLRTPPLYISCGQQDEFGFFEGSSRFAAIALDLTILSQWVPLQGEHCVYDAESVSEFLIR